MIRLFLAWCLLASGTALDGSYAILTSTSTGLTVGMNLYLPPGYGSAANAARRYPLMVFLGGAGERGDPTDAAVVLQKSTVWGPSKEIRYSDRDFPFVVVTPISTKWYSSMPADYAAMIDHLKATVRIDADRIYFTGACAGASGVMEFAQVHPAQVAAIVPAVTQPPTPWAPARLQQMPTWLFHAFADPAVHREQTITWADAIANSFGSSSVSCMDNYPYGTTSGGGQTYNPDNQTGSFRPGSGWRWTRYTRSADDALLLFTMMSTDLHNVWHYAVTNDIVLHWMTKQRRQSPFGGTPAPLPGRIQAESFDFGGHLRAYRDSTVANIGGSGFHRTPNPYDGTVDDEQVDLAAGGGGTVLTGTAAGEWLEYTVNGASGTYALRLRLAAGAAGGSLRLLKADGSVLAGPVAVPATAGFATIEVPDVQVQAGIQTLRLAIDQGGFDLDWFEISEPSGPVDLIIDNRQSDKVSTSGPWTPTSYTPGFYGPDYLSAAPGSDCVAIFRPNLPHAGFFTVHLRYPANGSRGISPVTIDHDGGSYATTVDQRRDGGTWVALGSFPFAAGGASAVTIRSQGAGGYVSADAVRFVQISALPPLDLIIDNDDAGRVAIVGAWSATTTAPGYHGANYLSTAPASTKRVVYRPNLPRSGTFAISVWYPATPSRGTSPVTIAYGDGDLSEVINVDQRVNGGRWNLLGTFPLAAGTGPAITIGSFATGGWIGADAVRLVETDEGGPG